MWDAGRSSAACLFCATAALEVVPESPPTPDLYLPAKVSAAEAAEQFRGWATRSWFRPRQLRASIPTLQAMLLPAWRVDAGLETHWAGLRRAATRSGRAPVAGVDRATFTHMIPASAGLSSAELVRLLPFDDGEGLSWSSQREAVEGFVWEPPALSRRGALARARRELGARHCKRIASERGLVAAKVSSLIDERDIRLLLVPIYMGSFRFRDRPWRFLINAQTGAVVGEAPLDRKKVAALVVALALLVLGLLAWGLAR